MTVRKVSYTAYCRSISFWIEHQEQSEEIRLTRQGKVVGVLYGEPVIGSNDWQSRIRRCKTIKIRSPRSARH